MPLLSPALGVTVPDSPHATVVCLPTLADVESYERKEARVWDLLRAGGCVVLMRHAVTVAGVGDPPGFRLDDCSSQRNLSDAGRQQARALGEAFQRERVQLAEVRSSAWCRCVDTAQLAFGRHTVWAPLNSFFQVGDRAAQTRAVLQGVAGVKAPANWMLVTHQVNMTALTGEFPASGEVFVTRFDPSQPERLRLLARQAF